MNTKRALILAKRIGKQIGHDKRTLAMLVLSPLLFMVIFGYSFGGEPTDVKIIVINQDEGFANENFAQDAIGNLDPKTLTLVYSADEEKAKESVIDGEVWAVVIYTPNFTKSVLFGENLESPVTLIVDGSDPTVADAVLREVNEALADTLQNEGVQTSFSINKNYVYGGENVQFIDFFAPGIICTMVMLLSLTLTIIFFVRERITCTLDRLFASPITEGEITVGYTLAFSVISVIQSVILLSTAIFLFNITIQGSILLSFCIILLSSLGFQGFGVLLSTVAKSEFQATQFIPLLFLPSILLAGVFWPLESIPSFLRPLAYIFPLTYATDALHSVTVRGWGANRIMVELGVLSFFSLITICSSYFTIKRRG